MTYCSDCGQPQLGDGGYCHNCGSLLGSLGTAQSNGSDSGSESSVVPWRAWQVVSAVVVVGALSVPAALVALNIGKLAGQHEEAMSTWLGVHLVGLVVLGAVWFFGARASDASWSALGLRAPAVPWPRAALLALGTLAASLAASVIYVTVVDFFDAEVLSPPDISPDIAFPGLVAVFTFQALAVVTPVVEEMFFRGFIFAGLTHRLGALRAAVVSAAVFSVFHVDLAVLIPIFVTGLLLAWLYHRTGSLWPGVLAHAGQNTLALAVGVYGV